MSKRNDPQMKKQRGKTRSGFIKNETRMSRSLERQRKEQKGFYGNGAGFYGFSEELGHRPELIANAESITRATMFDDCRHFLKDAECFKYYLQRHGQASREGLNRDRYFLVKQVNVITGSYIIVSHIIRKGSDPKMENDALYIPYRLSPLNKRMRKELDVVKQSDEINPNEVFKNVIIKETDNLFQSLFIEYLYMDKAYKNKDSDLEDYKNFQRRHLDGAEIYKSRNRHLFKEFVTEANRYIEKYIKDNREQYTDLKPLFNKAPSRFYVDTQVTFKLNGRNIQTTPFELLSGKADHKLKKSLKFTISQSKDAHIDKFIEQMNIIMQENVPEQTAFKTVRDSLSLGINLGGLNDSPFDGITFEEIEDKKLRDEQNKNNIPLGEDIQSCLSQGELRTVLIANKAKNAVITARITTLNVVNPALEMFGYNASAMKTFMAEVGGDFDKLNIKIVDGPIAVKTKVIINPFTSEKLYAEVKDWLKLDPTKTAFKVREPKGKKLASKETVVAHAVTGRVGMKKVQKYYPEYVDTIQELQTRNELKELRKLLAK